MVHGQSRHAQGAYFRGGPIAINDACPLCGPLCGQPDLGSHTLARLPIGGCSHLEMNKMTIFRHDEAHRLMLKCIIKGRMGSFLVSADVSKTKKVKPIGVHHKWMGPDSCWPLGLMYKKPEANLDRIHDCRVGHPPRTRRRAGLPISESPSSATHYHREALFGMLQLRVG